MFSIILAIHGAILPIYRPDGLKLCPLWDTN